MTKGSSSQIVSDKTEHEAAFGVFSVRMRAFQLVTPNRLYRVAFKAGK